MGYFKNEGIEVDHDAVQLGGPDDGVPPSGTAAISMSAACTVSAGFLYNSIGRGINGPRSWPIRFSMKPGYG